METDRVGDAIDTVSSSRKSVIWLLLTAAIIAVFWWQAWFCYRRFEAIEREQARAIELAGSIEHLDEVLTMSARMAAATGDPKWERRYRHFEPQLEAAIREALALSPDPTMRGLLAQTDAANIELVAAENQAFDLIRRGDRQAAADLLQGEQYERNKRIYREGFERFTVALQQRIRSHLVRFRNTAIAAVAVVAFVISLLTATWIGVLQMRREIAHRKRVEAELRRHREHLEELVDDRAGDLRRRIAELGCLYRISRLAAEAERSLDEILQEAAHSLSAACQDPQLACARIRVGDRRFATPNWQSTPWTLRVDIASGTEGGTCGTVEVASLEEKPKGAEGPFLEEEKHLVEGVARLLANCIRRKRAEEALRESEARYADLYDRAPDMFASIDAETAAVLRCNQTLADALGYTKDEIVGRSVFDLYHPDVRREAHDVFRQFVECGEVTDAELQLRRKDGTKIDVCVNASAVRDSTGKILYSRSIWRDISQRKQIESALERIEWLLTKSKKGDRDQKTEHVSSENLVELNTCRVLIDSVGEGVLADVAGDYLDLLDTSSAIYEENGDYALGLLSSGWCRLLDRASRDRCRTDDNRQAMACGKWWCHESCWTDTSKVAIETGRPADVACHGGIHIYAVPIWAGKEIVGAINFGYGDPPRDRKTLQRLADKYEADLNELAEQAESYESRPPVIVEIAKRRLATSARLIGAIVERKRAEESCRSLARFPSENPGPVLRVAKDGILLYANPASGTLLDEWNCRVGGPLPDPWRKLVASTVASQQRKVEEIESGGRVISFVIAPIEDADHANMYGSDVTALKRAEQQVRTLNAELEQRVKQRTDELKALHEKLLMNERTTALGAIAAGVAHELNGPLMGIVNQIQYAMAKLPRQKAGSQALEKALNNSRRCIKIIQDLLTYARQAGRAGSGDRGRGDLNAAVQRALCVLEEDLAATAIDVTTHLDGDLSRTILEEGKLLHVVLNLVENARDAMTESARRQLVLQTQDRKECVALIVQDSGVGMDQEIQSRAFDPLFTTKHGKGGTGLGLQLCKSMVEWAGGTIDVESTPGRGSTFTVLIPKARTPEKEPYASSGPPKLLPR